MIALDSNFEAMFLIPPTHRLVAVRSRTRAGIPTGTFWDHEEYDEKGLLIARYKSFAETGPRSNDRRSGWEKYDLFGRLITKGDLSAQ